VIGIILLFLCQLPLISQTELSGLFFHSHEVIQDKRTSLNLTPDKQFRFSNSFSLEFDVNFRKDDGYYGYIFRIIGNNDTNIDLVCNLASDDSNLWLVYKDEILLSYRWYDLPSIDFDQWVKVRIDFDLKNSRITTSFNERKQEIQSPDITRLKNFQMHFGACKAPSFYSTDVCPMSIKNISIYKQENKLFRQWELGKHLNNKVFDNVENAQATVENPNWLIDKYINWRKLTEIKVDNLNGITPNNNKGIFFIDDKAVYHLTYRSLKIDTIPYTEGTPYRNEIRHDIIYNKYTDEIWSYDFTNPKISRFNLQTGEWSNNQSEMNLSDYGHHNKFISPIDSSLITILGYGHYRYKGIVNIYDKSENKWKQIDRSDQITPRYLSSAGYINDKKALVFGGYGSKSGRQELSPRSYYDLYEFDLTNHSFTPLWTLPSPKSPFVPSETLVVDPFNDNFYTLLFNNGYYDSYLQLGRFAISEPQMAIVGDSIPFKFRDSETWSYLYLNEEKSDLIAVIAHNNNIALYAIAYPPLMTTDILQDMPTGGNISFILIIGIIFLVLLVVLITLFIKKKKTILAISPATPKKVNIEPLPVIDQSQISAIYLLGGFQVFNKNGENITSSFSPTLKQLFLFLLFNSVKERKGVTSAKLDEVLWYDKTGDSARNNRNVNISKLRSILEEIGNGLEVTNKNSLWNISFGESIYCDYLEILELIAKSRSNILSADEIFRLLGLINRGELLPNTHSNWLTFYKSNFSKDIIDIFSSLLNTSESQTNINIRYHIAELLLSIDPLNEEAMIVKCSILSLTGKKSIAKQSFDLFAKDYEKLMGSPYPHSFNKFV